MAKFSIESFALRWYFFNCPSSVTLYAEYFNLFMKQLGFNPSQIGLTSLLGVPHLFVPLCLLFGEKFRARKIMAVFGTVGILVCCMLPLISLIVPAMQPTCDATTPIVSATVTHETVFRNGSLHWRYANNTNNPSAATIYTVTLSHLTSQNAASLAPVHVVNTRTVYPGSWYSKNVSHPSRSKAHNTMPHLTSKTSSSIQQLVSNNSSVYPTYSDVSSVDLSLDNFPSVQQRKLSNGSIHSRYLDDTKHSPATNTSLSAQHSILQNTSPPSTSPPSSISPTHFFEICCSQSLLSVLFLMLIISRSATLYLNDIVKTFANLATITYLKGDRTRYGAYFMWYNLGSTFSVCSVAVLAWLIRVYICGVEKYGYFIAFILGGVMTSLSIPSLSCFKFEYDEKKSFNWSGVKSDVFNAHYIFMFVVLFYTGLCVAFQVFWEFWYIDGLSGSPLLLCGAALIRRPLLAASTLSSGYLIRKIGDLQTVCLALFLYAGSFFALSFTHTAWLVMVIDTGQAVANGISYCAFTLLFYKGASKENSGIILGRYWPLISFYIA